MFVNISQIDIILIKVSLPGQRKVGLLLLTSQNLTAQTSKTKVKFEEKNKTSKTRNITSIQINVNNVILFT